jgi:hypothetical protein
MGPAVEILQHKRSSSAGRQRVDRLFELEIALRLLVATGRPAGKGFRPSPCDLAALPNRLTVGLRSSAAGGLDHQPGQFMG